LLPISLFGSYNYIRLPAFFVGGGAFQYYVEGPPLYMAICPALTLAFSLNVSLISFSFKSAVAAVLAFSILCSSATTAAAVATCLSKTFLDSAGFHGDGAFSSSP
jgi:uncharacterized membrane protein YfhO